MRARRLTLTVLIVLATLSVVLNVWQWIAARLFHFGARRDDSFAPPLSIYRPLKGCDSRTERCLESWFRQEYGGGFELLFGVASASDPVCEIVRRLKEKYPAQPAELIICQPILGANAKVSSLCYLARKSRHEHVVISDQDVLIPDHFLSTLVQPLADGTVGLVNCFYVLAEPQNLSMELEAVAVNSDFWSQVLQGNMLAPMDFALGAVMATTRSRLDRIGGFEILLDYLADDYQLGNRIAETGVRLVVCPLQVECHSDVQDVETVWNHQLRWARTVRVCRPVSYFFSILSNGTLWPALALTAGPQTMLWPFFGAVVVRMATAWSNYRKLAGTGSWKAGILAPIKDLLQVPIWALAFFGKEIVWRGERFRVDRGGKLTPLA